jgi:hypothetical protein
LIETTTIHENPRSIPSFLLRVRAGEKDALAAPITQAICQR